MIVLLEYRRRILVQFLFKSILDFPSMILPKFLAYSIKELPHNNIPLEQREVLEKLSACANLRDPVSWYPEALKMERKIIMHVGPTNRYYLSSFNHRICRTN
jgi:hypothetical protein